MTNVGGGTQKAKAWCLGNVVTAKRHTKAYVISSLRTAGEYEAE